MPTKSAMLKIVEHIHKTIDELDNDEVDTLIEAIKKAERVYLVGAGRSGLVTKAFAMRLAQLGLSIYVVGEPTSPAITDKDLLICVSGSGETKHIVSAARIAKEIGTKVLSVTSYPESTLARVSDHIVKIEGRTKIDAHRDSMRNSLTGQHTSLTPLGTLFEDTVLIFFDGVIAKLMHQLGRGESDLSERHAKLEWFY